MQSICGILLLTAFLCLSTGHELPKNFERCKAEDGECLVRRVNEVLRSYPQGFKDLHLQNIDPLKVNALRFAGNSNSPVNLDFTLSDLSVYGLSNLTITKFDGFTKDPKDLKQLHGDGFVPLLTIKGKYKTTGKLLVVPVVGEGDITISVKDLQIKTRMTLVAEQRDGKSYVRLQNPKIKVKAGGLVADPKNLFNGNKAVADSTVKVINDNWEVLWEEVSPQLSEDILVVLEKIVNSFTNNFAYEDIFL